jgi:hypothetical protein
MPGEPIQNLWIGPRLSTMERLSIASYMHHGHVYHLYTYWPVEGLPSGALLQDAAMILPESMIFQYREHATYAGFANYFRYKLLLERGGWWVDTDSVCLRPFGFDEPYVVATEPAPGGGEVPTNAFLKAPPGSPAMAFAWESCLARNPRDLKWGETGPRLVAEFVARFGLERYLQPASTFCPVSYEDWKLFTEPAVAWPFGESTRAAHLWHELWRRAAWNKDREYHPGSLYEHWKRVYLRDWLSSIAPPPNSLCQPAAVRTLLLEAHDPLGA